MTIASRLAVSQGGFAFPWSKDTCAGMTMRQWYAGQALMGILARPCDHKRTAEQRAAEARQHADAMIEARI